MVRQHEYRSVEHGIIAPPPFPLLVDPRTSLGPELVAAHDLGTDACRPVAGECLIDAGASARSAVHLLERASPHEPLDEASSGVPERLFEGLSLTGAEAVQGDGEVVDSNQ